jgi:hypothetical protein
MKNIYIIETNKEPIKGDLLLRHIWKGKSNECISWWRYNETITIDGIIQYTTLNGSFRDIISSFKVQKIYITSDEEIKEGDYGLGFALGIKGVGRGHYVFKQDGTNVGKLNAICNGSKKIILTTDQDLIKYGIQPIDDTFLEWFVAHPSCKEVALSMIPECACGKNGYRYSCKSYAYSNVSGDVCAREVLEIPYKIIIPYEEPNQEIIASKEDAKIFVDTLENPPDPNEKLKNAFEKQPKQETLEEAAERIISDMGWIWENTESSARMVARHCAKWQQEQDKKMYIALETAISLLKQTTEFEVLDSWKQKIRELEQFKNK